MLRKKILPLATRIYHLKRPIEKFFCPLCRTERAFSLRPGLNNMHYTQIGFISLLLIAFSFNRMLAVSFIFFPIVWAIFEVSIKLRFKKEIPCPHCGFDASWYKRDVRVAKKLVTEFWQKNKKQESN